MEAGDDCATGNQGSADPTLLRKTKLWSQETCPETYDGSVCVCVTKGSDFQNVSNEIT